MVQYEWLIYIVSDLRACTENLFKAVPVGAGAVFALLHKIMTPYLLNQMRK